MLCGGILLTVGLQKLGKFLTTYIHATEKDKEVERRATDRVSFSYFVVVDFVACESSLLLHERLTDLFTAVFDLDLGENKAMAMFVVVCVLLAA
jgi:hypothetical protein